MQTQVFYELQADGMQRLVYEQGRPGQNLSTIDVTLPYRYAWSCSDSYRTLTGNGIPNHGVLNGEFATEISEQKLRRRFRLCPQSRKA